jgi:signal transduction histidine kinase
MRVEDMNLDEKKIRRILAELSHFMTFFLLMAFVISCCMILFLKSMQGAMGRGFTQNEIQRAARLTFLNVILLSLICTIADTVRRIFMVDRPVKKIATAAEKMMQGDLSVRIEKSQSIDPNDGYNIVIDYFNKMAEELSGMETLRTDFVANVSHELKTPLAVIQNYGTMLQNPSLTQQERVEYAKTITDAARDLANMVSNILKLNKLENQNIYPDTVSYDVGEQLCECVVAFEDVWEKKGIELEADIDENIMVTADPELLTLVWNNLLSNAIKFTDDGGQITVSLKSIKDRAVISISDTGCGISQEVGKHIFEKFYQGDTSHAVKGNGLGLALVKRVIDITGGDISVSSEVGKGSTFTVTLDKTKG